MKILITGSNGLLGQKIISEAAQFNDLTIIATARGANRLPTGNYEYVSLDITNKAQVMETLEQHRPEVVINTAAMTNVDQSEDEKEACWELNVTAVEYLTAGCNKINAHLIHLSTDFIFDGTHGPLKEDEKPNPVNYYGETKLASEQVVQSKCNSWAIARTVLVYGIAQGMSRSNIILWVKESLEAGKTINVVNDQWRTPTLAEDLAIGCLLMAKQKAKGIYHISGKDMLTPYEMAIQTADFFKLDQSLINETDGSKFQQTAKRPPKTGFIIAKAQKELDYEPRSFKEGIAILKEQMVESS